MALALAGLRIWDGTSDELRPGLETLHVDGERIAAAAVADGEDIDLRGAVAIPGLCDAHVHIALDPERRDAAQDASSDPLDAMAARARAMLAAGITTARDLAGPEFGQSELRDRTPCGHIPGPRVLHTGTLCPTTSV